VAVCVLVAVYAMLQFFCGTDGVCKPSLDDGSVSESSDGRRKNDVETVVVENSASD